MFNKILNNKLYKNLLLVEINDFARHEGIPQDFRNNCLVS